MVESKHSEQINSNKSLANESLGKRADGQQEYTSLGKRADGQQEYTSYPIEVTKDITGTQVKQKHDKKGKLLPDHPKSRNRCAVIIGVVLAVVCLVIIGITVALLFHYRVIGGNPTTEGKLSQWGKWSTCSITCGPGTHVRNRTCSTENCVGIKTQQEVCVVEECPRLVDSYGSWTTWKAWGSCGKTCGESTQTRIRNCQLNLGQYQCVGNATQTRSCDNGICPDCDLACSGGNFQCIACQCEGNTVSGKVLTVEGVPLQYVQISYEHYGHTPLGMTDKDGSFTFHSLCAGNGLLFSKETYLDAVATINATENKVRLTKYEPLSIAQAPNSRSAMTGDCVRLVCIAEGNPGPSYYEWFKDDMLVISHDGTQELHIQKITKAEAGNYRCRASNDYFAVFSRTIQLTVEGSVSEICNTVPRSRVIDVPYGCEVDGSRQVDIGTCSNKRCALDKDTSCDSNSSSRCDVVQYERQIRQCDGYQIPLDIAVACGCVLHYEQTKVLNGEVLDSEDDTPIAFTEVKIGNAIGSLTDARGSFSIDLPEAIARISVTVSHPIYTEHTVVLMVSEDMNHYYRIVHLTRKPQPRRISAAGKTSITITSNVTGTVYNTVDIPENSFVDEEGESYSDDVLVFVENYDPRDTLTVQDAPGDFTAIDIEGQTQYLLSAGMIRMQFTDVSGNTLSIRNNISLSLQLNLTELDEAQLDMKLWTLDSQNRWRFLSDVKTDNNPNRLKRQTTDITDADQRNLNVSVDDIPGIYVTNQWVNFDKIWAAVCLSKVRVFENNMSDREITNARVQVITLMGSNAEINTVSEIRPRGDDTAVSGQCIAHPCDTGEEERNGLQLNASFRGYIIARDVNGEFLKPAIDQNLTKTFNLAVKQGFYIATDLNSQKTTNGPFYNSDYFEAPNLFSLKCTKASQTDNAFTFYKNFERQCMDNSLPATSITSEQIIRNNPQARKHFYSSKLDINQLNACFMRIRISEAIEKNSVVTINNYIQNTEPTPENWYGLRQKCVLSEFTCIEYKAPGVVYNATSRGWTEESTQVVIFLTGQTNVQATLNSLLDDDNNPGDHTVTIHLKEEVSAHEKGLFCESVDFERLKEEQTKIAQAMDLALKECEKTTNDKSWAVSFT